MADNTQPTAPGKQGPEWTLEDPGDPWRASVPLRTPAPRPLPAGPATRAALATAALLAFPMHAQAQENRFEDLFSSYLGANASGYLAPLAQVVTGSLNSGFVRPSPRAEGMTFRLDIQAATALVSNSQQEFLATTEEGFSPQTTTAAPTILGKSSAVRVPGEGGTAYIFPAGLAVQRVVIPIPQLTVGWGGSDASVRWVGVDIQDVGRLDLLGVGARHRISRYLPELPVELTVGVIHHSVTLDEELDLSTTLASVQVGRPSGAFDLYGGVGWEFSSGNVRYDPSDPEESDVEVDLEGVSGPRATAGVAFGRSLFTLSADITLGTQNVFTFGVGIGR
ncbi:MAG: DUF6588 family protein [Gemmatimonadota bacterium]